MIQIGVVKKSQHMLRAGHLISLEITADAKL
jgi:hypothetical protein